MTEENYILTIPERISIARLLGNITFCKSYVIMQVIIFKAKKENAVKTCILSIQFYGSYRRNTNILKECLM